MTVASTVAATQDSTVSLRMFKAMPYAAAPTGTLRWKAPQPAKSWTETRRKEGFSAACMQAQGSALTSILYAESSSISEDCLFLNLWTPVSSDTPERPVSRRARQNHRGDIGDRELAGIAGAPSFAAQAHRAAMLVLGDQARQVRMRVAAEPALRGPRNPHWHCRPETRGFARS